MSDANPFDAPELDAGDARPLPAPSAPDPNASNPFDDADMSDPNVLRAAPAPTPWESFKENFSHGMGDITRHASETVDRLKAKSVVERGRSEGIAQPGEVMASRPTQDEFDQALGDLAAQQAEHDRWDTFRSEGFVGKTAAVLGGVFGGLLDPVNLLPIGRVGAAIEGAATAVGAREIAANFAARAGEFGAFTGAADAASQGFDIASGYQQKYDAQRTLLAAGLGAGLGTTMAGAATLIKGLRGELPGQIARTVEETLGEPRAPQPGMVEPGKVGEAPTAPEAIGDKVAVPGENAPNAQASFQTAKGSIYEVHEDGTTTRTKAARDDVGHEGDFGEKPRTEKTVYLDPADAQRLAPPQGKWRFIDHEDGTVSLATQNADGKWGISPDARNVPVSITPEVGKTPLELWKQESVNGLPGYGKAHFGNEIVSVDRASSGTGSEPIAFGTITPQGRMAPQPTLGPQSVTARMSADQIKADLGTDIPGTLIHTGPFGTPEVPGITAWHGTPHDFERFDSSKIGTGEGAQAFGHGLYFAQNEGVARGYQKTLSENYHLVDGKPVDPTNPEHIAASYLQQYGSREAALAQVDKDTSWAAQNSRFAPPADQMSALEKSRAILESGKELPKVEQNTGFLYQVQIKAHPDHFLDWDKPLSEQSAYVRERLAKFGIPETENWPKLSNRIGEEAGDVAKPIDGAEAYSRVAQSFAKAIDENAETPGVPRGWGTVQNTFNDKVVDHAKATEAMRAAGIEGIRYADAGSRGKGEGTSNFVVFDDSKIHTVAKNGKVTGLNETLRGEAQAKFADELKAAGVKPEAFDADILARAEAKGGNDLPAAIEQSALERAYEAPETRNLTRKTYGKFKVQEAKVEKMPSLIEALAKEGLKPDPELKTIFGGENPFIPGSGRLIRKKGGMSLDDALTVALEGRYLRDGGFHGDGERTLAVNDLLEAIRQDHAALGNRKADDKRVYPEGYSAADRRIEAEGNRNQAEMEAAEKNIRDEVKISEDHEPPPEEVWRDAAAHMVFGGEKDAHRAFDRAVLDYERTQGEHEALIRATHGNGEADRGAIRARAGYDEEGRVVRSSEDVRGAGETGGVSGRSERTAAGDQTLIPGVEPVTDRQRAGLGAEKPLRGGNEPLTDGLFNPEAGNQGEMFLRGRGPVGPASENRRLAIRDQLPGEAETAIGPKPAIADAQAREHRLNDSMKAIAAAMGRRLEMDGRMSTGALGAYKPAEGVLRIKYAGDIETFAHELGHAVDQRLSTDPATQAAWRAIRTAKPSELLALDYNSSVTGGKPSIEEGVAEFLRTFIVNPAYAQTHAPLTFDAFRAILAKQPELSDILAQTARLSQIESGLAPTQVFASMIASGKRFGLEKLSKSLGEHGIIPTVKDYATAIYGGLIRENVHFDRLTQFLRDRAFEKTGKPESLTFARDPDHLYRQLPGAEQSAIGIIDKGVPLDISDPFTSPRSPSLTQAVARALNGSFSRLENDLDPLVVDLNAYLVARRARGEWDLFKAGQLRNQPVRASENETLRAISEFEAKYPQFKQSADDIFAFQRAMLKRKVDKGMISQETANAYLAKRTDHVPLYRDFGEEKAGGGAGQSGFRGLQFSDQHSFGGSTRDVKNVIRSMIEDVSRAERRIAENDVLVALDDLAQKAGELAGPVWEHVPNYEVRANSIDVAEALRNLAKQQGLSKLETDMMIADLGPMIGEDMSATVFGRTPTTPRGERVLFMYRGGERQAIKVGDNDISKHFYDLMTAMSAPEKDIFLKMIGAVNASFQSAITHAPRFLLGTYIRDNMTRMFIPRFQGIAGRIPMAQDLVGIYSMLFDRSFYRAYMEGGGIRGGVYSHAAHEMHHDALAAATSSSGYMTRTLDQIAAEGTLSGKAAVLAKAPGEMARSAADYIGALGRRVAYKEGALAKGVAVVTTPAKMVSDALRLVEMSETASRLGGAKLTFKYLKKQGLSDAEAMAGALYESRDVLNYSSRGAWMGKAARVFPFMQAGITGADRSARGLVAEPVMAAMRAFERGGWDKLDARDQGILSAAWKNWLYIAAAAGTTQAIYYPFASNTDFYRRASQYMKDTYFMLQTGIDADGNPVGLTIHKGYDIPAAVMTTAERFAEEIRRADPIRWGKVLHGLIETVPRQFRSWSGLLEASPAVKTAFEVKSGMRLGMDGAPASPIIPDALKGKPIEQQAGAMTSEMAKWMGKQFHVSPLVVDHVINGMGGTGGQDIRDLSSAVFGNNPLMTTKDAMNRFFFGQVYRTAKNDTGAGQDIRELMARDHGSYQVQARAYRDALESDDTQEAQAIYNKADDAAKAFMLLQSSSRFKPEDRGLHPLQRSSDIAGILYPMMRDLGKQEIAVQDRSRKKGEVKEKIELTQEQARQLQAQFSGMLSEETRNGLTMVGHPGYEDFSVIDTRPRMDIIKSIDEDTYAELQKRMKAKHVLPAQGVANAWPETKRRLLQDGRSARIHDLAVGAKRATPVPADATIQ